MKGDYLETLLDAKNYDNFVWADVLSFPWLSSFEAKARPCGMNRNQCTMMAERSGRSSFPMNIIYSSLFFLSLPPPCNVPEMAGVCGGNFNLQRVHLHYPNISLVHQRKCH